jgi:hypothetical protein
MLLIPLVSAFLSAPDPSPDAVKVTPCCDQPIVGLICHRETRIKIHHRGSFCTLHYRTPAERDRAFAVLLPANAKADPGWVKGDHMGYIVHE